MGHIKLSFQPGGAGADQRIGVRLKRIAKQEKIVLAEAGAECPPCPPLCLPRWSAWEALENDGGAVTGSGKPNDPFVMQSRTSLLALTMSAWATCYAPCPIPLLWQIEVYNGPGNPLGSHDITWSAVDNGWNFVLSGLDDDGPPPYPVLWLTPTLDPDYLSYPSECGSGEALPFGDLLSGAGPSGKAGTVYVSFA